MKSKSREIRCSAASNYNSCIKTAIKLHCKTWKVWLLLHIHECPKKFYRNENCNSPSRSCSISVFISKLRINCTKTETSTYLNQFKARYYVFSPNAGKYRPENFRIRTLFTQWYSDGPSQPPYVILGWGVILKNCRNKNFTKNYKMI